MSASQEAAVAAVHAGDTTALRQLLADHPDLATVRLDRHGGRTLLHIATDWPGHFLNVADTISSLVAAGADPNTPSLGKHPETPLHWAASSDDIAAIDALLDAGADVNATGAVIAGGTPMADATAFGQWAAARRLFDRGADVNLFEAAALGLVAEVRAHLLDTDQPTSEDITSSFWGACHGGHIDTAAVLLDHGADINWIGYDGLTPLGAAHRSGASAVVEWLEQHGAVCSIRD
jgi:ankyrin repeat protein